MFIDINFKKPVIKRYPNKWCVQYYYKTPVELSKDFNCKKWKRFRVYEGINSYKGQEQEDFAQQLLKDINKSLEAGFNPFTELLNYNDTEEEKIIKKYKEKEAEEIKKLVAKLEEERAKEIEKFKSKLEPNSNKQVEKFESESERFNKIEHKQNIGQKYKSFKDLFVKESDFDEVVKIMVDNGRMIKDDGNGKISFIPFRRSCKYEPESFRQALGMKLMLKSEQPTNNELINIYKKSFNIEMNERTLRSSSISKVAKEYYLMLSTLS